MMELAGTESGPTSRITRTRIGVRISNSLVTIIPSHSLMNSRPHMTLYISLIVSHIHTLTWPMICRESRKIPIHKISFIGVLYAEHLLEISVRP
jgi:hypothetical protein